jgi:hypothetical protein
MTSKANARRPELLRYLEGAPLYDDACGYLYFEKYTHDGKTFFAVNHMYGGDGGYQSLPIPNVREARACAFIYARICCARIIAGVQ